PRPTRGWLKDSLRFYQSRCCQCLRYDSSNIGGKRAPSGPMFVNSSAIRGSLSSCGVERWKQFHVVSFCCCPDGPRQAKELCDVIGRGDTDFEQVGARYATLLIARPCRK